MGNLGVGVYLIVVVWLLAISSCWISVRTGYYVGKFIILATIILTGFLVFIQSNIQDTLSLFGTNFVRLVMLVFFAKCSAIGLIYIFIDVCLARREACRCPHFCSEN